MSSLRERFFIKAVTEMGERLLEESPTLQGAMDAYLDAPEAQKRYVPGARLLGSGKYSFTFAFEERLALKISGPYTNKAARQSRVPTKPENLAEQFVVMTALREHPGLGRNDIVAPEQFFVAYSPHDNYILGQEFMAGWQPLEDRTYHVYYERWEDPTLRDEISAWTAVLRERVCQSLEGFELAHRINDIGLERDFGIHAGNLLVPVDAALGPDTPLCIIDQPK